MNKSSIFIIGLLLLIPASYAEEYGGVEFPDGAVSFADQVISYSPASCVYDVYDNPSAALGIPDFEYTGDGNWVSLGDEGTLALRFVDNSLTTSGGSTADLWIFEVGSSIEPTDVYISTDGSNWIYVGDTSGSTSGVDIDAYIGSGVEPGILYSYVMLVDLLPVQSPEPYCGADIDAVGAISSDVSAFTLSSDFTCSPSLGTLPFTSLFSVSLTNLFAGQSRQMAGHIDITLANGGSITNWRVGYTNIAAGESYTTAWSQNVPNIGSLVGNTTFILFAEDVTPTPYNQPPYPAAGDTDTGICIVTGISP